jgi:hypothetical protein
MSEETTNWQRLLTDTLKPKGSERIVSSAWLCSKHREDDPNRKMLAQGQGETPEQAADAALESFGSNEKPET